MLRAVNDEVDFTQDDWWRLQSKTENALRTFKICQDIDPAIHATQTRPQLRIAQETRCTEHCLGTHHP
jgi:hypothetical protein